MSIRTDNKPKAFETKFYSASGKLSQYGDFDFKPGEIVRKETVQWLKFEVQPINVSHGFVFQGKFQMRLKAQRTIEDMSVCDNKRPKLEKEGTMKVKPTTFNEALAIKASILCPRCDCEEVRAGLSPALANRTPL